ncbi:MAG TPA: hypothetical protein VE954_18300 [Oligoflexus sp.]|nr:hypothetical protein [Oligoflexus sp.]
MQDSLLIQVPPTSEVQNVSSEVKLAEDFNEILDALDSSPGAFSMLSESSETKQIGNITIKNDEIIAVARATVLKEVQKVANEPQLTEQAKKRLAFSALEFRRKCGDTYVDRAELGSRMTIIFRAKLTQEQFGQKDVAKEALVNKIGSIFNQTIKNSSQYDQIFNQISFSTRCIVEGAVGPSVCTKYQLNFDNRSSLDDIKDSFVAAQREFEAQVLANPQDHVMLGWESSPYSVPESESFDRDAIIYPYEARLNHINQLGDFQSQIRSICADLPVDLEPCVHATLNIDEDIKDCAQQGRWEGASDRCPGPPFADISSYHVRFADVLSLGNAGSVTLYTGKEYSGTPVTLNFPNLYQSESPFRPGILYRLDGFGFPDKELSSVSVNLGNWKITFYEDERTSTTRQLTVQGKIGHGDFGNYSGVDYDNRFTYFRIHR